ncbi:MAG: hypothetical protein WD669_12775 [Pirellulales bacterium]
MAHIGRRIVIASVTCVLVVTGAGCPDGGSGLPTAHLQGTVTIGGNPIPSDAAARISFDPTALGQSRSTSSIIKDGRFEVRDAPIGKVQVTFGIDQKTGKMVGPPGGRPEEGFRSLVPESKKNGVVIDVTGDDSNLKFDL